MPDIILEDPNTGNSWTVTAPDEASARQAFEKYRGQLNIPPDVQLQVRQPAAAPDESGVIDVNEQGNFNLPESPNFPEMNQPGEAQGREATDEWFRLGPNEAGAARMKDKTLMQKLGAIDQALGRAAESSATLGLLPAAEGKIREIIGPEASNVLFYDQPMDEVLEKGSDVVGSIPRLGAGMVGGSGVTKLLPESWLLPNTGARGVTARTAAAPVDEAFIQQADAALRGEDASITEGTGTALGLQMLGEALTKGTRTGAKKVRQRDMSELAKNEETMAPTVREWLKNVPYGPPAIPNADIRTQLGEDITPVIRSEAGKAPRAFAELKRDAQVRREGELGRSQALQQTMTGQSDTAAGQAQAFKDQRLDPNLINEYTGALQTRMPNAIGYVTRKTPDSPKKTRVIAPPAFLPTLTSSPHAYDAWTTAMGGTDGGQARAQAYARQRGAAEPGQAEVMWHTILKLEEGGTAEQLLAKDLKKRMSGVNTDLKQLVARTHTLGDQERGALAGDKVYTNPANLDKKTRELKSSPEAWKAAGDAFVARFIEDTSKGKLPKLTEQLRSTANELLGEQKASQLFRHYDIERRSHAVDEPIQEATAAFSPEALTKAPGKFKQALGAVARVLSASPGGVPAMLGAAGPSAARFLRDNPQVLSRENVEGLFSLLRQSSVPETKTNRFEKMQFNIATPGAKAITDEERRERRGAKKPVHRPGG